MSQRAIARGLDRPPSAILREVRRNAVGRHYDAGRAQQAARARCRRGSRKLRVDPPLFAEVRALMNQGWSPQQQVAGRLRRMHPDEPPWQVSHETLYCALYALPRGALRKELIAALRKAHQRRRPRTRGTDRRGPT